MTERKAWFCPTCQRHHAPHVETCPGPVDAVSNIRIPPSITFRGDNDPCAGCGTLGVCLNAACPKRHVVVSTASDVLGNQAKAVSAPVYGRWIG